MEKKPSNREKRQELIKKLKNKYRLVVMNDATFDESFSAYLTPLNVIAGATLVFLFIAFIVVSLIVFTPLKEYIPGYSDTQTRIRALDTTVKVDSLEKAQSVYTSYFDNLMRILNGEMVTDTSQMALGSDTRKYTNLDLSASARDSTLRKEIESEEEFALSEEAKSVSESLGLAGTILFPPIIGTITAEFDSKIEHYGIDVTAKEGETIKAVLDGTVVMSSFTSDGGNVIQILHANNLVSIYKHNSVLLKKVGDRVEAGDSIAIIGNSGELTDGPHLHFELWYNGSPLNPMEYIAFSS
ncbi:MAG: M23 family metallopeptidase [Flavobacteriales bacterium]|nr:M23 family metallopeptidase [Flavobacteriales bacterium]